MANNSDLWSALAGGLGQASTQYTGQRQAGQQANLQNMMAMQQMGLQQQQAGMDYKRYLNELKTEQQRVKDMEAVAKGMEDIRDLDMSDPASEGTMRDVYAGLFPALHRLGYGEQAVKMMSPQDAPKPNRKAMNVGGRLVLFDPDTGTYEVVPIPPTSSEKLDAIATVMNAGGLDFDEAKVLVEKELGLGTAPPAGISSAGSPSVDEFLAGVDGDTEGVDKAPTPKSQFGFAADAPMVPQQLQLQELYRKQFGQPMPIGAMIPAMDDMDIYREITK